MAVEDPSQIERMPWSELGPHWLELWGSDAPEHVEITGQTGSGKTYFLIAALQGRAKVFDDREILVVTKRADDTLERLGWPITESFADVRAYRQVVFWPQTELLGEEREDYIEHRVYDLLARLWTPDSNCVVAVDEMGFVQQLSRRMHKLVGQYWREARSHGITFVAMKQRPLHVLRDQHSETRWKAVFPPADRGDMRRFAELLGRPRDWEPVLESLGEHEFVLHYSGKRDEIEVPSYITWIDEELKPLPAQANQQRQAPLPTYRKDHDDRSHPRRARRLLRGRR